MAVSAHLGKSGWSHIGGAGVGNGGRLADLGTVIMQAGERSVLCVGSAV